MALSDLLSDERAIVAAILDAASAAGLLPAVLFFGWIAWLSWGKRQ